MARRRDQPRLLNETSAQLVAHLSDPNGWWRDTAQQLLVLKQDKSVVPALKTMLQGSGPVATRQLARIHALWTLEGLGAADPTLVRDADAGCRSPDAATGATSERDAVQERRAHAGRRLHTSGQGCRTRRAGPGALDDESDAGAWRDRTDQRDRGDRQGQSLRGYERNAVRTAARVGRDGPARRSPRVHGGRALRHGEGRGHLQGALFRVPRHRRPRHAAIRRHDDRAAPLRIPTCARPS